MEHNTKWEPLVLLNYCLRRNSILLTTKSNKNSNILTIKSKVTKTLKMLPWGDRVTVYLVERDMPSQSHEGTGEEYRCIIHYHTLHLGTKEGMPQTTNLVVFYHLKGQLGPP